RKGACVEIVDADNLARFQHRPRVAETDEPASGVKRQDKLLPRMTRQRSHLAHPDGLQCRLFARVRWQQELDLQPVPQHRVFRELRVKRCKDFARITLNPRDWLAQESSVDRPLCWHAPYPPFRPSLAEAGLE